MVEMVGGHGRGVVAAGGAVTAAAGVEVLRAGGSAADAAVAAALTAFHAEPLLASAAGGGMMLAGSVERGFEVLDFAPAVPGLGLGRRPELHFFPASLDFGGTKQVFHIGRAAAAVPATMAGLYEAHRRWGSLPLDQVVAPAVRACRDGVVVDEAAAWVLGLLEPVWSRSEESASLMMVDGRPARSGERLLNPEFARTLERLADEGPDFVYQGDVAERIVDAFGPAAGGLMTAEDLAAFRPEVRRPLDLAVAGGSLLTPPPPSLGGTLVALTLGLLARAGLAPEDLLGERHLRSVVDAQLLANVIRREALGPGTVDEGSVRRLLGADRLDALAGRLGSVRPARSGREPGRGCTTHVSVLDGRGGAASVTVSYGEGCGWVIPGTGMQMNNFLGEEDLNPDGFHLHPAGARLPTMMAPTVFLRDGRPHLVLGSGGANRLRTAIVQVAFNHLLLGQELGAAVEAPRVHVEDDRLYAEVAGGDRALLERLAAPFAGSDLFEERALFFGGVHAAGVDREGRSSGAGDPRRGGVTAGGSCS